MRLLLITMCYVLVCGVASASEPCGCTRETIEPEGREVCKSYFYLLDEGFDVRVTCEASPKYVPLTEEVGE